MSISVISCRILTIFVLFSVRLLGNPLFQKVDVEGTGKSMKEENQYDQANELFKCNFSTIHVPHLAKQSVVMAGHPMNPKPF